MTRDEALIKLLAVEPETKDRLILATGWPPTEAAEVLRRLVSAGRVCFGRGGVRTAPRLYRLGARA